MTRGLQHRSSASICGLAVDAFGSIYAAGALWGSVDFDPGTTSDLRSSLGQADVYVLNLDSAGNFGWVETFGGSGIEAAFGIAVDATGTMYLAGRFDEKVDFERASYLDIACRGDSALRNEIGNK